MEAKSKLLTKAIKAEIARNGPNGISLLMVSPLFLSPKRIRPKIAPSQKEIKTIASPCERPNKIPKPKTILASPNPINRPLERIHSNANGAESKRPAMMLVRTDPPKRIGARMVNKMKV